MKTLYLCAKVWQQLLEIQPSPFCRNTKLTSVFVNQIFNLLCFSLRIKKLKACPDIYEHCGEVGDCCYLQNCVLPFKKSRCYSLCVLSDLEWKIIYVGSAESEEYDQVLDSVLVGPVPAGRHMFVFQVSSLTANHIDYRDFLSLTTVRDVLPD